MQIEAKDRKLFENSFSFSFLCFVWDKRPRYGRRSQLKWLEFCSSWTRCSARFTCKLMRFVHSTLTRSHRIAFFCFSLQFFLSVSLENSSGRQATTKRQKNENESKVGVVFPFALYSVHNFSTELCKIQWTRAHAHFVTAMCLRNFRLFFIEIRSNSIRKNYVPSVLCQHLSSLEIVVAIHRLLLSYLFHFISVVRRHCQFRSDEWCVISWAFTADLFDISVCASTFPSSASLRISLFIRLPRNEYEKKCKKAERKMKKSNWKEKTRFLPNNFELYLSPFAS